MSEILPVLSEPIPASAGGHVPDTAAGDFGAARLSEAGFRGRTRPHDTVPQAYAG
jgi:hypothetical protein